MTCCLQIPGMPGVHEHNCPAVPPEILPGAFSRAPDAVCMVYRHGGRSCDQWRERFRGDIQHARHRYQVLADRMRQGGVALVMERDGYRVLLDSIWAPRLLPWGRNVW